MPNSLDGRVALIIGGSGGIGEATARLFAGAGARIVITHTNRSAVSAAALAESLPGAGHLALPVDVADTASLLALRDAVRRSCGEVLHILVNAAGTPLRRVATPTDVAEAVLACATSLRFSTGTTVVVDGGRSL
jgi:3-oxoacyl-[acyl-carrier protein] reductase